MTPNSFGSAPLSQRRRRGYPTGRHAEIHLQPLTTSWRSSKHCAPNGLHAVRPPAPARSGCEEGSAPANLLTARRLSVRKSPFLEVTPSRSIGPRGFVSLGQTPAWPTPRWSRVLSFCIRSIMRSRGSLTSRGCCSRVGTHRE